MNDGEAAEDCKIWLLEAEADARLENHQRHRRRRVCPAGAREATGWPDVLVDIKLGDTDIKPEKVWLKRFFE